MKSLFKQAHTLTILQNHRASSQNTVTLTEISLIYDATELKNSVQVVWRERSAVQSLVQCARVQLHIYYAYCQTTKR
jgi:hypothetical protein